MSRILQMFINVRGPTTGEMLLQTHGKMAETVSTTQQALQHAHAKL